MVKTCTGRKRHLKHSSLRWACQVLNSYFFLSESLLNRSSMQNLLIPLGQFQEKNGHWIREKNPLQRFALFSCGQVCRIGSAVRSGICFCTLLLILCGFQCDACGCRCCFVTVSPAPLDAPAWACLPCAFQSWQTAFGSAGCLFWNVLEGVNFSRDTSQFPACSLAPVSTGCSAPGSALVDEHWKKLKIRQQFTFCSSLWTFY